MTTNKPKYHLSVQDAISVTNRIHGKGAIIAFVWSTTHIDGDKYHGMAVRQFLLGNMDAREFTVAADGKSIRFLQQTRLVIRVRK